MESYLLTRAQYDAMLNHDPDWMWKEWPRYTRRWCLLGVRAYGSHSMIIELVNKMREAEKSLKIA